MLKVDSDCLYAQSDMMRKLAAQLEMISNEISDVSKNLSWKSGASLVACTSLNIQSRNLSRLDERASTLAVSLREIAEEYIKTEKLCADKNQLMKEDSVWQERIELKDILIEPVIYPIFNVVIGTIQAQIAGIDTDSPADRTWLGYEIHDDDFGVTAWGGKTGKNVEKDWGYAGVNGYLGKVDAKVDADFSFMKKEKKKAYKDGKWEEKEIASFVNAELGAGASVNILSGDVEAGVGDDMLGIDGKGEVSVGNAKAEGKGKFSISEDGVDAYAGGEAMVSAVEGEAKASFNFLGFEVTGKVGGYAGAVGVEGKIGIEDNKFVMEGGAAALLGISGGIEIGFNDEGWDNFVDFVTFWD